MPKEKDKYKEAKPIKRLGPNDCWQCGKTEKNLRFGLCDNCYKHRSDEEDMWEAQTCQ